MTEIKTICVSTFLNNPADVLNTFYYQFSNSIDADEVIVRQIMFNPGSQIADQKIYNIFSDLDNDVLGIFTGNSALGGATAEMVKAFSSTPQTIIKLHEKAIKQIKFWVMTAPQTAGLLVNNGLVPTLVPTTNTFNNAQLCLILEFRKNVPELIIEKSKTICVSTLFQNNAAGSTFYFKNSSLSFKPDYAIVRQILYTSGTQITDQSVYNIFTSLNHDILGAYCGSASVRADGTVNCAFRANPQSLIKINKNVGNEIMIYRQTPNTANPIAQNGLIHRTLTDPNVAFINARLNLIIEFIKVSS